jgi:hypothetical protein
MEYQLAHLSLRKAQVFPAKTPRYLASFGGKNHGFLQGNSPVDH